jgi:hypothetical protein
VHVGAQDLAEEAVADGERTEVSILELEKGRLVGGVPSWEGQEEVERDRLVRRGEGGRQDEAERVGR